jgi:hypothetical protein
MFDELFEEAESAEAPRGRTIVGMCCCCTFMSQVSHGGSTIRLIINPPAIRIYSFVVRLAPSAIGVHERPLTQPCPKRSSAAGAC